MPLRHCSMRYSIRYSVPRNRGSHPQPAFILCSPVEKDEATVPPKKQDGRSARSCRQLKSYGAARSVRHLALLPVLVLIILHDGRDGLEPVFVAVLHRVLEIEVL